jgi:plasmid stabilization system protein ParE
MAKEYLNDYAGAAKPGVRMPKFILSEFVEAELADIWDYIAIDDLDAADRFLECAYKTFQELSRTPGMGRVRAFATLGLIIYDHSASRILTTTWFSTARLLRASRCFISCMGHGTLTSFKKNEQEVTEVAEKNPLQS